MEMDAKWRDGQRMERDVLSGAVDIDGSS